MKILSCYVMRMPLVRFSPDAQHVIISICAVPTNGNLVKSGQGMLYNVEIDAFCYSSI